MSTLEISKISRSRQIIESLLYQCDVIINGDKPGDIKVNDSRLYKRVLKEGSIGLGKVRTSP